MYLILRIFTIWIDNYRAFNHQCVVEYQQVKLPSETSLLGINIGRKCPGAKQHDSCCHTLQAIGARKMMCISLAHFVLMATCEATYDGRLDIRWFLFVWNYVRSALRFTLQWDITCCHHRIVMLLWSKCRSIEIFGDRILGNDIQTCMFTDMCIRPNIPHKNTVS